jgi:hypothetical protein
VAKRTHKGALITTTKPSASIGEACHACGGSGRKKEKDQLQNFAKFRVEKATHHATFLYEAMAMIVMATLSSLGSYLPSP